MYNNNFEGRKFSSLEEEDSTARKTIDEFNILRNSVLTTDLLDAGFSPGSEYRARSFAKRYLEAKTTAGRPLVFAVFGTSFTIGSNCGESSVQSSYECAWPGRLAKRWEEVFFPGGQITSPSDYQPVEWRNYQENAQTSSNIGQKLPAIIEEFKNYTPDVIFLDNTISDIYQVKHNDKPWFEAVVRVMVKSFPETVLVSLVDAQPRLVDPKNDQIYNKWLHQVQEHYGLAVVDIAKMTRLLRFNESYNINTATHPTADDNGPIDYLWPQSLHMALSNGTKVEGSAVDRVRIPVYFASFLPLTRKTKFAYYPENHPAWATHQYVADSVMYALLRVLQMGMGCRGNDLKEKSLAPSLPETTIALKEAVDACFMCLNPLAQIDARSTHYIGNHTNSTEDESAVVVTCGDWKWITDERNRSGWQSDQYGSIIRFRIQVSDSPTISFTYMKSHSTFGAFRVTFVLPDSPPLGCKDIAKFKNETLTPSLAIQGDIPEFSLWDTAVFPATVEVGDSNTGAAWKILNQTILSQITSDVSHVDMYVLNINQGDRKRVKIQTVTSC